MLHKAAGSQHQLVIGAATDLLCWLLDVNKLCLLLKTAYVQLEQKLSGWKILDHQGMLLILFRLRGQGWPLHSSAG